ncbi:MAG: ATPase [Epsilonproteobacteria bacterium]|nr:MAG: ATPase [Campylobacterota bacterium]
MNKKIVYDQIDNFKKKLFPKLHQISAKQLEKFVFYVNSEDANNKAIFIKELIKNKLMTNSYNTILDLTFGSGNLTSHLILENNIKYKQIIFNDTNIINSNQSIVDVIDNSIVKSLNILDVTNFNDIDVDLVILNPQISGIYEGDISKINDYKNKLRETIEYFFNKDTIIIFYGVENNFKELFDDKKYICYICQNNQLYIINKEFTENKCYEKIENEFILNEDCTTREDIIEEDLNISEFVDELNGIDLDTTIDGIMNKSLINIDNKDLFNEWWMNSTYNSVDGKPFKIGTKKGYFRAVNQLNTELDKNGFENILIFTINNINYLERLLERLENGDLVEYNKRHKNSDTSNGLKQYIKFLNGESNGQEDQLSNNIDKKDLEFSNKEIGNINFPNKNILFKGVPGTGKSKTIDDIIKDEDKLNMKDILDNVLRINIHSASSNSDLMQGISISTTKDKNNVLYEEKQGAILSHIFIAIYKPKQPFVLVLEEIQENSLNELIGDLIYLIEDKKRTDVELSITDETAISYDELFKQIEDTTKEDETLHSVELPSLVEGNTENTKMIVPNNLFIFCTSNYRDDKKVIEDNLLRRFDVVEIYPKYDKKIYKSEDIPIFLEKLNDNILKQFISETHPDRYMIGHANWLYITKADNDENKKEFYKALLKVVIEFKEIREIDFKDDVKPILEELFKKDEEISDRIEKYLEIFYKEDTLELESYKEIVEILQKEVYSSFL